MRRLAVVALALGALLIAGCGSTTPLDFKGKTRPAAPVDVSVYVSDRGILISPTSVGAGLVVFYITNQANQDELIATTHASGSGPPEARSGELAPNATATVTADLRTGSYLVGASGFLRGNPAPIRGARLHVGGPREAGDSALLQP